MTAKPHQVAKFIRIERGVNGFIGYLGSGDHGRQSGQDPFFVARSFDDLCDTLRVHLYALGESELNGSGYAPWFDLTGSNP